MKHRGRELLSLHASRTVPKPFSETVVVLDSIRSMYNVGSIFRTSEALSICNLVLCGITPAPPRPEISKSALGAEESVPFSYFEDATSAIKKLKSEGYLIIGVEQTTQSVELDQWPVGRQNAAFVFGNEVNGISNAVLSLCDQIVEIPQFGRKHSLNVSVSVGIVLFHYLSTIRR